MTRKHKPKAAPCASEKTRWAYWMQGIEPTSKAIEKAFPGHHPLWVQRSQRSTVSADSLAYLRQHVMGLSQAKAAAYLRVSVKTLRAWEKGQESIPFMAFELLRLVYESAAYRLSNEKWDGWFIAKDGCFVSPDVGRLAIQPHDFTALQYTRSELEIHRAKVKELQEQIAAQVAENTGLRGLFLSQGVVDELRAIQARVEGLLDGIATAEVIPFNLKEAAA
jgi:DNA-binding XRE family transcriptional regulator